MSYRDYHKKRIEHLNKIVNSLPGETICDLGSWEGCLNTKRKVYRVDINKEFKPDVVADARNMPFKSGIFELVVCSHVIEHVKNPLNIVKEAKRILKSGGLLLLETPNISSLKNKIKLMLGKNITSWKWNSPKPMGHLHYREYTMSELRELIACVGLIEKSNYGNISYRCGRKGMILERISSFFPKSWKHSIGIIGIKTLKKGVDDADMNCPNGRFLRNKFVYEKWIKPFGIDNILDLGCSNNYMKILHKNTTGIDIQGNLRCWGNPTPC